MGRVTWRKHARMASGKTRGGVGMRDVAEGQGTTPVLGLWRPAGLLPPGRRAAAGVVDALPRSWARAPASFWSHGEEGLVCGQFEREREREREPSGGKNSG